MYIQNKVKPMLAQFEILGRKHSRMQVFEDFLTIAHCALWIPPTFEAFIEKENEYKRVMAKYTTFEHDAFIEVFARLSLLMEEEHDDYLGTLYNLLQLSSRKRGEVYTPMHIAELLAEIQMGEHPVEEQASVMDPACGSGALIIGYARVLNKKGVNASEKMYAECTDISLLACKMAFIQLSLMGVPAQVKWGNALKNEYQQAWFTSACYTDASARIAKYRAEEIKLKKTTNALHRKAQ